MARLSPYIQLLLARKRPTDSATTPDVGPSSPVESAIPAAPPITIGARPANSMAVASTTNLDPLVDIQPRTAAETVQGYDRGMHPDRDIPQMMVPYHRNRGLQTLEAVGDIAASGFGVNLQHILHPRGTDEQRARRALHDEQSIQSVELQKRSAESNMARDQSAIGRDATYAEHLKALEDIQRAAEEGRITREEAQQATQEVVLAERERHNRALEQPKPDKPATPYTLGRYQRRYNGDNTPVDNAPADAVKLKGRARRQHQHVASSNPSSPQWSKSQWAAANPSGDPNAAEQYAKSKGFQVVH